jgi:hypothetical protein
MKLPKKIRNKEAQLSLTGSGVVRLRMVWGCSLSHGKEWIYKWGKLNLDDDKHNTKAILSIWETFIQRQGWIKLARSE